MITKKIAKKENPLVRFLVLVRKELAIIVSDKQALLIVFLLPVAAIFAVGATGASMGPGGGSLDALTAGRRLTMGVVNEDTSVGNPNYELSEEFINIIKQQPDTVVIRYDNISAANESLYYEEIMGYVIIGDGFETNVSAHLPALVEFYADSLNVLATPLMAKKINDAVADFKQAFNYTEDEIIYQSEELWSVDSPLFISLPMIVVITLIASGLMLACQSVVGDNPIFRVILTPAGKLEILSAKVAAYTVLHMIQGLFLLIPPMLAFNMSFLGNFFAVWGYLAFPIFSGVCFGVFFSTLAKTKLQGSQFFLVGFMVSFILGSGVFLPEGTIELLFPMVHAMDGVLKIAYKDLPFQYIWPTIWPQIAFGLAFFTVGYLILLKKKGTI